ncbi:MAG: tol-pal system protein YbgF [Proteobacteria bacterium]|nr:tol-pal system protein YbgF [Pseudomonadota bacterium]
MVKRMTAIILGLTLVAGNAIAEEQKYKPPVEEDGSNAIAAKLDRLEKNLNTLQRQVYSGSSDGASSSSASAGKSTDADALAQQMKSMRGDIEQLQYEVATLNDKFLKFTADIEMRINDAARGNQTKNDEKDKIINSIEKQLDADYSAKGSDAAAAAPVDKADNNAKKKTTPEEDYQVAYSALKNKDLIAAENGFKDFVKTYANHKLVGGARYWLGEIYYTQGSYEKAVIEYLKGYQRDPKGVKAADNLLKLGISLSKLDKRREACVTFNKLQKEHSDASKTILQKSTDEAKKLRCE